MSTTNTIKTKKKQQKPHPNTYKLDTIFDYFISVNYMNVTNYLLFNLSKTLDVIYVN